MTVKHAHELEAAGEPRWSARQADGLLMVKDEASGQEVQATAYTVEGDTILFSLPGDNGLRRLAPDAPGYAAFRKALEKGPIAAKTAKPAASKPAPKASAA